MSARRKADPDQAGLYLISKGEVVPRQPTLAECLARIDQLELEILDLEKDLRGKRTQITKLKAELDTTPAHYDRIDEVGDIFNEWRQVCDHPYARLTLDRFHAVRKLLDVVHPRPYKRVAFTLAFAGAAYDPFVKRQKNGKPKRYDDLELICRDGAHFEEFIQRAPEETA